ncbi:hypothetical protein EIN_409970 [Entamoeba invadens IP1]|uniref:Uncharacterized protein n=2 Tax=Entamoeba invadens TaxID=33085 RepID=A0A0A1U2D2_ENTIV|nr:hypothetical protein EIN_409970 [Entamoeba invadens IP1]ELP85678.1 hypothetical protein EIN_409970 [Entamoeba invadens IP1]BAN40932.1 hypothetical protein [Entamoeba invadens]|eukprot:XP_004185024.1 hypothetical protein EIN_409970 [Entamoeba invadens IP1]
MSNPYQTCPPEFYQQFKMLRKQQAAAQQAPQTIMVPVPVVPQQRIQRKPALNQTLQPMQGRRGYVSQTFDASQYAKMKAMMRPQMAPQHVIYTDQNVVPQMVQPQIATQQPPMRYVRYQQGYDQQNRVEQQRRDSGRLAEIRGQIDALNAEVASICLRNDFEEDYTCQRVGAVAPNPTAMKYGRIQNPTHYQDELADQYDPSNMDMNFFSPSMSPQSFVQNFQDNDEFDDWENEEDFSMMQPIQIQPIQPMKPVAVRQEQPLYVPVQQVPYQNYGQLQYQQQQFVNPPQRNGGGMFANPYRNKGAQPKIKIQPVQPVQQVQRSYGQQPQQRFQQGGPWQNSAFAYYQ